ncbi:MAG: hypothetical protein LBF12_07135 [Christensenellaceae bacterium]|nr:hypothetical protein [Christensenellaceae bacterium]
MRYTIYPKENNFSILINVLCDGEELNAEYKAFYEEKKHVLTDPGYEEETLPFLKALEHLQTTEYSIEIMTNITSDILDHVIKHIKKNHKTIFVPCDKYPFSHIDPYCFRRIPKSIIINSNKIHIKNFMFVLDYMPVIDFTPDVMQSVINTFIKPEKYIDDLKSENDNRLNAFQETFIMSSSLTDMGQKIINAATFKFLYVLSNKNKTFLVNNSKDIFNPKLTRMKDIPAEYKSYFKNAKIGDTFEIPLKVKKGKTDIPFFDYHLDSIERPSNEEIELVASIYIYGMVEDDEIKYEKEVLKVSGPSEFFELCKNINDIIVKHQISNIWFYQCGEVLEHFPDFTCTVFPRRSLFGQFKTHILDERKTNRNLFNYLGERFYNYLKAYGVKEDKHRIMGNLIFNKIKSKITYTQIVIERILDEFYFRINELILTDAEKFNTDTAAGSIAEIKEILRLLICEFKYQVYNLDKFDRSDDVVDLKYEYPELDYEERFSEFLLTALKDKFVEKDEVKPALSDEDSKLDYVKKCEKKFADKNSNRELHKSDDGYFIDDLAELLEMDDYGEFTPLDLLCEFDPDGYIDECEIFPVKKCKELEEDKDSNLYSILKRINEFTGDDLSIVALMVDADELEMLKFSFTAMIRTFLIKNKEDYLN